MWSSSRWFGSIIAVLWLSAVTTDLYVLWAYDNQPGVAATAESQWPAGIALPRDLGRPTLVMLAHPQCTCTRASLTELAELLARADARPKPKPVRFQQLLDTIDSLLAKDPA